jgi:hypothetical protein
MLLLMAFSVLMSVLVPMLLLLAPAVSTDCVAHAGVDVVDAAVDHSTIHCKNVSRQRQRQCLHV